MHHEHELVLCGFYLIVFFFQSYDCNDEAYTIPILCTFELLYIRIEGDEPKDNTRVLYTVYSGQEKPSEEGMASYKTYLTCLTNQK